MFNASRRLSAARRHTHTHTQTDRHIHTFLPSALCVTIQMEVPARVIKKRVAEREKGKVEASEVAVLAKGLPLTDEGMVGV